MKQKRIRSRKKVKISNHKGSVFKNVEATPSRFTETMCPTNLVEQKQAVSIIYIYITNSFWRGYTYQNNVFLSFLNLVFCLASI